LAGIFLTGHIEEENVEAGRALGATYLTKPFVASALLAAVERCVPKNETW
jgi:DNA-binding response OmpR family regulator